MNTTSYDILMNLLKEELLKEAGALDVLRALRLKWQGHQLRSAAEAYARAARAFAAAQGEATRATAKQLLGATGRLQRETGVASRLLEPYRGQRNVPEAVQELRRRLASARGTYHASYWGS